MSQSQELIKTKIVHYLKATWYARWIIIGLVLVSFWFLPGVNRLAVEVMAVMAIVYNMFLGFSDKLGLSFLSNRLFMEAADSSLAVVVVFFSGGIGSPYAPILALMIVSIGYWYGAFASVILGLIQLSAILAYEAFSGGLSGLPKAFIVQLAVYITMGVYVAWLSQSTRSERSELVSLGTEAEKERQQLLALINNMGDAVLVIDPEGKIMIHNQAAESLIGADHMRHGQPLADTMVLSDREAKTVKFKTKQLTELAERKDLRLKAADGSLINVTVSIAPYIVNRQNRGYVLILKDITDDKTLDQEREDFVAVAAHELRTPLTIAQGNISLMLSPPFLPENPEAVARLNGAMRSLKQLSNIINDLTDLSLVDTRHLDVELESLNPLSLLREFQSDYTDQAKAKGLSLELEVDSSVNLPTILTSSHVIREILTIFMTNAIKFTDSGSVKLGVENRSDRPQGVTFSVSDTGIGIAQSDQKKIFEKFFQSENYMTRVHGGTGLGLYIAKKLAERLTGDVWFETELSKGSTFYLWVPLYSHDKEDQKQVASEETKDLFSSI